MPPRRVVPIHKTGDDTQSTNKSKAGKPKPQRERIQLIETRPKPEWFVKSKDEQGCTIWYLRMQVTGQLPRRYGPFETKHVALLFLDKALDELGDAQCLIESQAQDRMRRPTFRYRWLPVIIEDELASQYARSGRK